MFLLHNTVPTKHICYNFNVPIFEHKRFKFLFFPTKNESEKALREGILAKSAISVRWVVVEAMERERVSNFFFFFFFAKTLLVKVTSESPPLPHRSVCSTHYS